MLSRSKKYISLVLVFCLLVRLCTPVPPLLSVTKIYIREMEALFLSAMMLSWSSMTRSAASILKISLLAPARRVGATPEFYSTIHQSPPPRPLLPLSSKFFFDFHCAHHAAYGVTCRASVGLDGPRKTGGQMIRPAALPRAPLVFISSYWCVFYSMSTPVGLLHSGIICAPCRI
ncbi:hypothetical protein K438DRAFT_90878 [Mycena galopus ATCC 62051]|nr:hypothetical protein K438DRAFT_90878 [Mycena galopus ATCC 62051]